MKFLSFLIVSLAYLFFAQLSIYACSCTPEASAPTCQKIGTSDVVFAGTVIEKIRPGSEMAGSYRFRVDKVYKGLKFDRTEVVVVPGFGSCVRSYSTGKQYLIFGSNSTRPDKPFVHSGPCNGSRTASEADLAFLDRYLNGETETVVYGRVLQWVTSIGYPQESESTPVANAEVFLEMGQQKLSVRSGDNGWFAFGSVPPGSYYISSTLSPFIPFKRDSPITVTKGGCHLVFPELRADVRIGGKVVDHLGRPVMDTRVELLRQNSNGEWYRTYRYWTNTKSDGTFSFEGLESGNYLVLHDSSDDSPYPRTYAPGVEGKHDARVVSVEPRGSVSDILLKLPQKHKIRTVVIKVVNEDGSAIGPNLLQVFTKNGLISNFGGFASRLGVEGFEFKAYQERTYEFGARYWVDDLDTDIENRRLLLAEPIVLSPGKKDVEITLRLTENTSER